MSLQGNSAACSRVAILGAAFDPPHYAHAAAAVAALQSGFVDEVWLVPSPPRWDKTPVASADFRFRWVSLLAERLREKGFAVVASDAELGRGEFRGTYEFLMWLRQNFRNKLFSVVVGADAYLGIPQWRDPVTNFHNGDLLVRDFPVLLLPRAGTLFPLALPGAPLPIKLPSLASAVEHLGCSEVSPSQVLELQSSVIRAELAAGSDVREFIYPNIVGEIVTAGVY